ncbi:UNVERIFIED_CONTAM: hypothetical protein PYX00_008412 [Menopon gallinae]|uniref:CUB domain-containing protein n=1 Tax=Menopon gallinae TaxID=328185 RepID=A0AAW2HP83_9NEOP
MCLLVFIALSMCVVVVHSGPGCKVNEFSCRNGKCIRVDRYCDGINDCGDKSDEPSTCSPCNRTYYGDIGKTYDLEIPRPRSDRIPFFCHLTFTANGHNYGDFIQLLFDSFHIGRYEPLKFDGCPDGYMQIMELGRPFTGGSWCGSSSGRALYYSETSTITATVKLFYSPQSTNFQFKLRYRFVSDIQAVARYGSEALPVHRGEAVPGTYCSRNFYDCSKKNCRLQSPNYPGMYPRNVTCSLSIRQKDVPTCKHAMIVVKQENSYKMQIKRSIAVASMNKTRALKTWNDCSGNKDYLVFHDGPTVEDPVLLKFCGGDWLPRIASRGPEMLVIFHSSPYSEPSRPSSSPSPFTGFELDVDVFFADSDSLDFVRDGKSCEFVVNATSPDEDEIVLRSKGRTGYVVSPRHTLPPNTTCMWHFRGQPSDLVWLYFITYFHETLIPIDDHETGPTANKQPKEAGSSARPTNSSVSKCSTRLRIWDGGGKDGRYSLLGDYCELDIPKLCDHSSLNNLTRATRPCTAQESYISTGPDLLIQLYSQLGTALHPVSFRLSYSFVDTRLGGEHWISRRPEDAGKSPCVRIFRRKRRGLIHSPRNIFLYGKGGATNLSCVYRIEGSPSDRVKLTLLNASFGENSCMTESDPHSLRPRCVREEGARRIVELRIFESPWREVGLPHSCFCDNSTVGPDRPFVVHSASRSLEIHFRISEFNITEDYLDLYFNARFELIKSAECERQQKIVGSGGEIEFTSPPESSADISCFGIPWLVEAHQNTSLFLLTWGTFMPHEPSPEDVAKCPTRNRILIYSGRPSRLLRIVCPLTPNSRPYSVHIFSEEWLTGTSTASIPPRTERGTDVPPGAAAAAELPRRVRRVRAGRRADQLAGDLPDPQQLPAAAPLRAPDPAEREPERDVRAAAGPVGLSS